MIISYYNILHVLVLMLLEADPLQDSLINTLDIQLGIVYDMQNCCWIFFYYNPTLECQNVVVGCFYFFTPFGFLRGQGTPPRSKINHTLSFIILTYESLILGWLVSIQLLLP